MNKGKCKIAILYGGISPEHSVSVRSAQSIIRALPAEKYDVIPIGIDRQGKLYLQKLFTFHQNPNVEQAPMMTTHMEDQVIFIPGNGHALLINVMKKETAHTVDIVFPILHGNYGEDGAIQGLLKYAHVPFVGSDILASAACMDKSVTKALLQQAGLPTPAYLHLWADDINNETSKTIQTKIGFPCFVKPSNQGSSIGVTYVSNKQELEKAINEALRYDNSLLVEKAIQGRELECAVLGNGSELETSKPCEIINKKGFYSYTAKYSDPTASELRTEAALSNKLIEEIQNLAKAAFTCLQCSGMARVDFFLDNENKLLINEINTIPGFTAISQYPAMWQAAGLSLSDLLERLITLAFIKFDQQQTIESQWFSKDP